MDKTALDPHIYIVFYALQDSLEVKTYPSPATSLIQRSILLNCHFINPKSVKLEDIAVKWSFSAWTVYMFDGRKSYVNRTGATMDLNVLEKGNASLYLEDVTVDDEGDYTCTVLISPDVGRATILLTVSAQPIVNLRPLNPHLQDGELKTFFCDVQRFYPPDIEIFWHVMQHDKEIFPTKNICTGIPTLGSNGTFSVTSQVTVIFSEKDDGAVYICGIRHISLEQPLTRNTTLFLATIQKLHRDTGFIVGVVFGNVIITGIFSILLSILYQKRLAKAAPLVSTIIMPDVTTAHEKLVVICNIQGFRPKAINVHWYIDKSNQDSTKEHSSSAPLLGAVDITEQAQNPVSKHGSVFNVTSQLSYTPSIQDNKAVLICEVEHKALHKKIRRKASINVTARPQKCYITSWPQVPQLGEKLVLSCIVEKFFPKHITLTWLKNGQLVTNFVQFGPFPHGNDYYDVWSQLELLVTEEDDGLPYMCQIKHCSLGKIEELTYEINLQGTPPKVKWITGDSPNPVPGQELKLSCKISNFSPQDITVEWFRNSTQLHTGICNSLCIASSIGLHSMWSVLKFVCDSEDHGSVFTCKVHHVALRSCEERSHALILSGHHR